MSGAYTAVALVLRVALGGIFLFAAYNKIALPLPFSEAIEAFRLGLPRSLVELATFAIPWTEIFCGVGLVLGIWTRASAGVFLLLMGVFLVGIVSAILRHLPLDCGCFGKYKLFCEGPIGWCKVGENLVLCAGAAVLAVCGAGRVSLDAVAGPASRPSGT